LKSPVGRREDIGSIIDPVLEGVAEELISKAGTLWGEGRDLDAVMITGGGGQALGRYFQVYPHAIVISDPAMANVRGFLKYAQRVFRSLPQISQITPIPPDGGSLPSVKSV